MNNLPTHSIPVDASSTPNIFVEEALTQLQRLSTKSRIKKTSRNGVGSTKPITVLIVDDDADMRNTLKELLQDTYNVTTALNGQDALKKIHKQLPNIIITDIIMPVMDGIRLLKEIRRDPYTSPIPIIAISALAAEEARIEGFDAGVDDYLKKPFSKNELLARIRSQLKITQVRNEAEMNMRNIFMQSPVAIAILNGNDYIVELANDFYLQIVEKGKDFIGRPLFDSLPELKTQGIKELLDNVMESGVAYHGNEMEAYLFRNNKRTNGFYNFVYHPVNNDDGIVTRIIMVATEVTEQVLSRKTIEASEIFSRTVLENSPDCVKIIDTEGRVQFMNYNGQCVMDVDDFSKIKDKYWWELWGKENRQMIKDAITKAVNGEKTQFQAFRPTMKGIPKWWDVIVSPLEEGEGAGSTNQIIAVSRDITEQMQAAKKIKESEERFRSLADNIPLMAFIIEPNADATVSYWNKTWLDYTGQTNEEAIGRAWYGIIHPDDVPALIENYALAFKMREPYTLPAIRVKRYDGKYRWHMVKSNPRYMPDGEFMGYIGVGSDIHESKLAGDALKESEKKFKTITDLLPEKVLGATPEGKVNYYNQNWLDYTGLTCEELTSQGLKKSIHPDDLEQSATAWQKSITTGDNFETEVRLSDKNGEYKWHLTRAQAVKAENGEIKMWIGAATEIQKVKDEEARKANFVKMVSHELKTPVTSIKGYIQILLMMLEGEKNIHDPLQITNSLIRVDKQVSRLTRLINEMLDLSRIDESKLVLQKELFSLNELVVETAEDMRYTNTKHTIIIHEDFRCTINGDRDRIGQMIINFIGNAIKYSPNNDKVEVRISREGERNVAVSVQDFGIGINKKDHQKIFERFYRVEGKEEQMFSGFGIGLYIAKAIIERHNGSITIESEKGKGSVFTFILPIAPDNL